MIYVGMFLFGGLLAAIMIGVYRIGVALIDGYQLKTVKPSKLYLTLYSVGYSKRIKSNNVKKEGN